jgi:hypothetical protein
MPSILNLIAKAFVLSWLVVNTLVLYGVEGWGWLVISTMPLSFALYNWYDLLRMEYHTVKEGDN